MTNLLARYWKTLAIASVSLTSSYFFSQHNESPPIKTRLLSALAVQASEYERWNTGKTSSKHRFFEKEKDLNDDDDDDDDDDKKKHQDDSVRADESVTNIRERRFRDFSSVEYDGDIYMTPVDFLESIISDRPRPRAGRRELTDEMVDSMLYKTPGKHRGSKRFFRNLEDAGLISFSEYLFLWVVLTKPATQFELAFRMFDTDGNLLIDRREFLVLGKAMSDKRMKRRQTTKNPSTESHSTIKINNYLNRAYSEQHDTTLLVHLFGRNGRDTLNYTEFKRFMENLQMEILEIEFAEFSHGFKTISDLNFAEMLLRYSNLDQETKKFVLKKVKNAREPYAITFEQFTHFFSFLNNLEEFNIAMRFHQLSNKPITHAEFQRAAKISTGFELESHIVGLIFRIFDTDNDQHLSYDEFMAVMKDRLSRGFQIYDYSDGSSSTFDQFKRCFRKRAKYDASVALN